MQSIKGTSLNTKENFSKIGRLSNFKSRLTRKPKPTKRNRSIENSRVKNFTRKTASKKIGTFMKTHRNKIRLNFLNTICSDSNVCIAFGKETKLIRKFFDDFDLRKISSSIKIDNDSVNGTVYLLTFEKDGYVANSVFKTTKERNSDNIAYEAMVGTFINKQRVRFPCFLETYGLYEYPQFGKYGVNKKIDVNKQAIIKGCVKPLNMGIMIENIKEGETLASKIKSFDTVEEYSKFMNFNLLYILYQIYGPLSILSEVFTHYDLHHENVMLYEPVQGMYIEYNYHYPDHTVTFNSKYIVKIIDYGKSFFEDETGYNPRDIYRDLCNNRKEGGKCSDCGMKDGFKYLNPIPVHNISSQTRNMSHDLRLLDIIKVYDPTYNIALRTLIHSTIYKENYGTCEITAQNDDAITNVNDARRHMEKLMELRYFKDNNDYDPSDKLGVMHIYSDGRPMEYIAV